jgi:hypothetical protein
MTTWAVEIQEQLDENSDTLVWAVARAQKFWEPCGPIEAGVTLSLPLLRQDFEVAGV